MADLKHSMLCYDGTAAIRVHRQSSDADSDAMAPIPSITSNFSSVGARGLLHQYLTDPWTEHVGMDVLSNGLWIPRDIDVIQLFQLLTDRSDRTSNCFQGRAITDGGATLWCWLYHLLGGAAAKLAPPPVKSTADTAALWQYCVPAAKAYSAPIAKLRFNLSHAADGTEQAARALAAWEGHFHKFEGTTLLDKCVLRLRAAAELAKPASQIALGGRRVVAAGRSVR